MPFGLPVEPDVYKKEQRMFSVQGNGFANLFLVGDCISPPNVTARLHRTTTICALENDHRFDRGAAFFKRPVSRCLQLNDVAPRDDHRRP